MEIAQKIQTSLLPIEPRLPGYEIAAVMQPADEVGGDYYDVINVGDMNWVVIGDVSGHGLPAGLIMMMVQTGVDVTLGHVPGVPPSEVLTAVNRTIVKNIRQLGETKYMTITLLAVHKDGRFTFSGMHQDIMIYRAAKKEVELVETMGMWIGMADDIQPMLQNDELTLNVGDALLLYSDGITEAWKKGTVPDHRDPSEMFGSEKLQEVFCKLGEATPDEVKQGILNELEGYDFDDDVTMVVLKRIDD
jgi:serine phosphatase RsbU (regulator of sigma subunit)